MYVLMCTLVNEVSTLLDLLLHLQGAEEMHKIFKYPVCGHKMFTKYPKIFFVTVETEHDNLSIRTASQLNIHGSHFCAVT